MVAVREWSEQGRVRLTEVQTCQWQLTGDQKRGARPGLWSILLVWPLCCMPDCPAGLRCGFLKWFAIVACTRVVAVWKLILIPPRAWQLMWKPVVTRRAVSQGWWVNLGRTGLELIADCHWANACFGEVYWMVLRARRPRNWNLSDLSDDTRRPRTGTRLLWKTCM